MSELKEKIHKFVIKLWDEKKISYNWNDNDEAELVELIDGALTAENAKLREALKEIVEPIGWGRGSDGEQIVDMLQEIARAALSDKEVK